jgi:hypothetical protein
MKPTTTPATIDDEMGEEDTAEEGDAAEPPPRR